MIWSGGQTGVDRAALDVARAHGLATRGWVPWGRRAEDGPIPAHHAGLQETESTDYDLRTTRNVRDSDATLILFRHQLTGGSAFTRAEAQRLGRPYLALDLAAMPEAQAVAAAREWLAPLPGDRLNVAGPRASSDEEIYRLAASLLDRVLGFGQDSGP